MVAFVQSLEKAGAAKAEKAATPQSRIALNFICEFSSGVEQTLRHQGRSSPACPFLSFFCLGPIGRLYMVPYEIFCDMQEESRIMWRIPFVQKE
jgi:hypothetical protein